MALGGFCANGCGWHGQLIADAPFVPSAVPLPDHARVVVELRPFITADQTTGGAVLAHQSGRVVGEGANGNAFGIDDGAEPAVAVVLVAHQHAGRFARGHGGDVDLRDARCGVVTLRARLRRRIGKLQSTSGAVGQSVDLKALAILEGDVITVGVLHARQAVGAGGSDGFRCIPTREKKFLKSRQGADDAAIARRQGRTK